MKAASVEYRDTTAPIGMRWGEKRWKDSKVEAAESRISPHQVDLINLVAQKLQASSSPKTHIFPLSGER